MDTETRSINHLQLVAYLQVIGIKQSSLPTLQGSFVFFHFKKSPELEVEIEKFYLRKTSVDALTILESAHTIVTWAGEIKRGKKGGDR